ncbi:Hypothetical_protein [Hexamita inflata]|uniref:Hypothetical_protein n=1 Tax=Hexamita inflata TaxID=28002 RepID=A0ABP1JFU2_9EUKA
MKFSIVTLGYGLVALGAFSFSVVLVNINMGYLYKVKKIIQKQRTELKSQQTNLKRMRIGQTIIVVLLAVIIVISIILIIVDDKYKLIYPAHDILTVQLINKTLKYKLFEDNFNQVNITFYDFQLQQIFENKESNWQDQLIARSGIIKNDYFQYKQFFIEFFRAIGLLSLISVPICFTLEIIFHFVYVPRISVHLNQLYQSINVIGKHRFKEEQKREYTNDYKKWF